MAHDHDIDEVEEHDRGLSHDLPTLLSRRRALALLGGAGLAAALAGCGVTGGDATGSGAAAPTAAASDGSSASGSGIPEETAGPYPGDGSNGVNVLTESGIVRSDITRSFGSASGVAQGVPLTITLKVLDTAGDAAPLEGAAVYFEVYPSLEAATTATGKLRTSRLAFPEAPCRQVYATDGYTQSLQNLSQTSLDTDMVFSDGYSLQLAKVTGDVTTGYTATLNVPV